jgi:kinesin family protein C2/C3
MMEVYNEKIRDLLIDSSNQPPKKLVSSFIATVLIW